MARIVKVQGEFLNRNHQTTEPGENVKEAHWKRKKKHKERGICPFKTRTACLNGCLDQKIKMFY